MERTTTDQGMVIGCMAVLRNSGMAKEQAVPFYAKLLDHYSLTSETVASWAMVGATRGLPTRDQARAKLLELFPELQEEV